MPHFQIDYSPNLEERLDIVGLCRVLRDAAAATGVFPLAGIRIRATACSHFLIADGNPEHAFLDISIRLRAGRDKLTRKMATEAIFAAAESFCHPLMTSSSFMLSLEMRDMDPELSPKASSIRQYMSAVES